jgi:antitoxin FitA
MGVAVTVRDIPEDVRDELAARAARAGQSLQEFLRSHLIAEAQRPRVADVIARARQRVETTGTVIDVSRVLDDLDAERR